MNTRNVKHALTAAFVLTATIGCSPLLQEPQAGDKLDDGTIYAGNNFATTPADAPDFYTWDNAYRYCALLVANGHNDWTPPTRKQLNQLYENKNTGAFAGSFKDSAEGSTFEHLYWSSEERSTNYSSGAWFKSFTDAVGGWSQTDFALSVRCVRDVIPSR